MNEQIQQAKIFQFPKEVSVAVERAHIFERDIEEILASDIGNIIKYGPRSNLGNRLEYLMLTELMRMNCPLNFYSIQAIRYIAELVSSKMTCFEYGFIPPEDIQFSKENLSLPDKYVLQYIFGLHAVDDNFLPILMESIEQGYLEGSELYSKIPGEAGRDLEELFTELANIVPAILDSIVKEFMPYQEVTHIE